MPPSRRVQTALGLVVVAISLASPAQADFEPCDASNVDVPVERLVKNIHAYATTHPHDPSATYALGRIYYFAFVARSATLQPSAWVCDGPAGDENHLPADGNWQRSATARQSGPRMSGKELGELLSQAIINLRKAVQQKPTEALYWNTLASALVQGAPSAGLLKDSMGLPPGTPADALSAPAPERESIQQIVNRAVSQDGNIQSVPAVPLPGEACPVAALLWPRVADKSDPLLNKLLQRCWYEQAIAAFSRAFDLAWAVDSKRKRFAAFEGRLSVEAGSAFIRLVEARGMGSTEETARLQQVRSGVASVKAIAAEPEYETPIVMALERARPLAKLVSAATVPFDLDGSGLKQRWSWVKPTTGLLVWDPRRTGRITSGHQLLGAVTFRMFWRNGYAALDALDDNRDGMLTGGELTGLALWFDRNSNGVSDPGEVVPVEALGIVALATGATAHDGDAPMNARGVFLRDGAVLPTYDWISHTLPDGDLVTASRDVPVR